MLEFVKNFDVKYLPEDYFTSEAWQERKRRMAGADVPVEAGANALPPQLGTPFSKAEQPEFSEEYFPGEPQRPSLGDRGPSEAGAELDSFMEEHRDDWMNDTGEPESVETDADRELREIEERERRTHLDEVYDRWNIGHMSSQELFDASAALREIGELSDKDDLIEKIMQQSIDRHTAAGRSVVNALRRQDVDLLQQVAVQQVFGKLADADHVTMARRIGLIQTIAHLMNVRTMGRNVISNAVFNSVDKLANNVAVIPDAIMGIFSEKRTVGFQRRDFSKDVWKAKLENAVRAYIDIALDVDTGAAEGSKYNGLETSRRVFKGANPFSRTLGRIERGLSYGLTVTDEWAKGGIEHNVRRSLGNLRDKGKGYYGDFAKEEIDEIARAEARYRTFQDDSLPAQLLTGLKAVLNILGTGESRTLMKMGDLEVKTHEFGLGDIVQKYTRVPGNLIGRFLEYSPTGYFKALYHIGRAAAFKAKVKKHGGGAQLSNAQQRQIALTLGRALTGTGLMAAFYALSKLGIFTGEREDETKEQKSLENAEGVASTQLNVSALGRWIGSGFRSGQERRDGDVLTTLGFLEPMNTQMALGYALSLADGKAYDPREVAKVTGAKVFDQVLDIPTMSTLRSMFNTINYGGSGTDVAIDVAVSGLTGFEGSLTRQAAGFFDSSRRNVYNNATEGETALARLRQNIPGLRNGLPAEITPFGEERRNTTGNRVIDFLNSFVSPGDISIYQTTDVSQELYRLAEQNAAVIPKKAPTSVKGEKLYGKDYEQFAKRYGQTIYNDISEVMHSDYYDTMSEAEKADAIADVVSKARTKAQNEWAAERGGGQTEAAASSGGVSEVTIDGTKYTLSPAVKVKYNRETEAKTAEYQGYLTSGAKTVENVVGSYKAKYYYNDLSEAQRQEILADYDKKIAGAKGGAKNTKEQMQQTYRQQKQEFIDGKRYREIDATGAYSSLPAVQKQVLNKAKSVAESDVQAEMKDEIISGSATGSSTAAAPSLDAPGTAGRSYAPTLASASAERRAAESYRQRGYMPAA